ncbi:MAG: hypothetical protein WCD76_10300, partial [Pyrinomonadaceae bacterium]
VRELQEEFEPLTEEQGTFGKIMSVAEKGLSLVEKHGGTLAQLLTARSNMAQAPQAYPAQSQPLAAVPPAATPQSPPARDPLTPVFRVTIDGMTADEDVDRAADAIDSLLKSNPEFAPMVLDLINASSLELLEMLAQATGASYITRLPHGIAWCEALKEELRERANIIEGDEAEDEGASILDMAEARAQAS